MGDKNQIIFGLKHQNLFKPPFLEVGSLNSGYTSSFRYLCKSSPQNYLGVDIENGPGVDVDCDLTDDFQTILKRVPDKFMTIFCLSVLEHCANPFKMAQNLERLLNQGGVLYVSVPFSWEIHPFPDDYWRFTPSGIRQLFPRLTFDDIRCSYHSTAKDVFYPIDKQPPRLNRFLGMTQPQGFAVYKKWFFILRHLFLIKTIFHCEYWYPPLQLNMIGIKK